MTGIAAGLTGFAVLLGLMAIIMFKDIIFIFKG